MKRGLSSLGLVVAIAVGLPMSGTADAQEAKQAKPSPTKSSVLAGKLKLEKARDAMRALAELPAPKGLTPPQMKAYAAQMQKVRATSDSADVVIQKIDKSLNDAKSKADINAAADMFGAESLKLQKAMDDAAKLFSTLSNMLKKQSDTAKDIISNLK